MPVIVGLLALLVCAGLYRSEANNLEAELRYRESMRMNVYATVFQHELRFVSADLHELVEGQALREFLSTGRKDILNRAAASALLFSRQHPAYDRIVFIDENGTERFSIGQGSLAPSISLQTQAHEPFFQQARDLDRGQIALSTFALASDQGRVAQPAKPILLFSTPVYGDDGRWRGVFAIHYLGASLLSEIAEISPIQFHRLRLLNAQGYWLKSDDPAKEWGFMYPDRAEMTLAKTDPGLWGQVALRQEGQVAHASGLFTWRHIDPREVAGIGSGDTVAADSFWVLASEVTGKEWTTTFSSLRQSYGITGLVLVALVGLTLQFRRSRSLDKNRLTLHFESLFESLPGMHVVLTPNMEIVAATDAYLKTTMTTREAIIGKRLFQAFPKNPQDRDFGNHVADANRAAIERLLIAGKAETMPVFRYDIRRADGTYQERHWRVTNSPLRGEHGQVEYIIHQVEDVTPSSREKD